MLSSKCVVCGSKKSWFICQFITYENCLVPKIQFEFSTVVFFFLKKKQIYLPNFFTWYFIKSWNPLVFTIIMQEQENVLHNKIQKAIDKMKYIQTQFKYQKKKKKKKKVLKDYISVCFLLLSHQKVNLFLHFITKPTCSAYSNLKDIVWINSSRRKWIIWKPRDKNFKQ